MTRQAELALRLKELTLSTEERIAKAKNRRVEIIVAEGQIRAVPTTAPAVTQAAKPAAAPKQ